MYTDNNSTQISHFQQTFKYKQLNQKQGKNNNSTGPDQLSNIKHLQKHWQMTDYSTSRTSTTLQSTTTKYLTSGNWQTSYRSPNQYQDINIRGTSYRLCISLLSVIAKTLVGKVILPLTSHITYHSLHHIHISRVQNHP